MTIDHITVRLYTCCKCGHKWTNWDRLKQQDSIAIPGNCPKCRNVRWNQYYIKEDVTLIEQLEEQHMVKKNAKSEKSWKPARYKRLLRFLEAQEIAKMKADCHKAGNAARLRSLRAKIKKMDEHDDFVVIYTHYFDFIAHDFLYKIRPMPEVFEIKKVLAIPQTDIEARHELMLSIIRDRVTNQEKYQMEDFTNYLTPGSHGWGKYPMDLFVSHGGGGSHVRRKMPGCKHKEHSLEILIALYKKPSYKKPYIYLQYPFKMSESDHLPDAHSKAVYKQIEAECQRLDEMEMQEDEAKPELRDAICKFKEDQFIDVHPKHY